MQINQIITGIPLWLVQEYIEELGGRLGSDGWLRGEGWQARLTQVEDQRVGSLRVGRVGLELEGQAPALESLQAALNKRLLRAGG